MEKIVYLDIKEIKPYNNNPRKNKKAVKYVANSIKEFGFRSPIVLDKDKIIICGHTRYMASKQLKLDKIPCIIAEDLTEEQVLAYRLADNKVSEKAEWDFDLLNEESEKLVDIDLTDFGFEFVDEEEEKPNYKKQELRTDQFQKLAYFDLSRSEGKYQMPTLKPCYVIPKKLIGFNYAMSTENKNCGIHFYLDDYQFERLWNQPEKYIDILQDFDVVLTPSYSLYMDMAEPIKIYNTFRSRLLGQMMQDRGINVIPIVYWADEKSYEYCFDGLPENAVLSTYTMGIKNKDVWEVWKKGMDELIKRKHPKTILLYGNGLKVDYDFGNIKVIYFKNEVTERMSNI